MFKVFSNSDLVSYLCQWLEKGEIASLSNCCLELSFTPYRCLFGRQHNVNAKKFYNCMQKYELNYDRQFESIKRVKSDSTLFILEPSSNAHLKLSLHYLRISSFSFPFANFLGTIRYFFVPFQNIRYVSIYGTESLSPNDLPLSLEFLAMLECATFKNYNSFPPHLSKIQFSELTQFHEELHPHLPNSLEEIYHLNEVPISGFLPSSLKKLIFHSEFNNVLPPGCLPKQLESLSFGFPINNSGFPLLSFNQPLKPGILNEGLKILSLGPNFNHQLKIGVLPSTLTILTLGGSFSHPLLPNVLPSSLQKLAVLSPDFLSVCFSNKNVFPSSMQQLWIYKEERECPAFHQIFENLSLLPVHIKEFNIFIRTTSKISELRNLLPIQAITDFKIKRQNIKFQIFNSSDINLQLEPKNNPILP